MKTNNKIKNEIFEKNQGRLCAHCVLEKLGGNYWYIIHNEPIERSNNNK